MSEENLEGNVEYLWRELVAGGMVGERWTRKLSRVMWVCRARCFGLCECEKRRKRTWWGTKPNGLYILRWVGPSNNNTDPFYCWATQIKILPSTLILISPVLSGLAGFGGKSNTKRTPESCLVFSLPPIKVHMYACIWVDGWHNCSGLTFCIC